MQGEQRAPILEKVKLFEYIALGQRNAGNFFNEMDNFFKLLLKDVSKTRQEAGNNQSIKKKKPSPNRPACKCRRNLTTRKDKNW